MRSEKDLKKYTFNKSLKSEWSEPCLLDNDDEENLRVITNIGVGIPIVENLLNNVSDLRPYMNEVRELSESQSKSSYPLSAQGISAVETGSFVSLAPSAPSYEDVMYQLYNVSLDNGRFYFCGTKILFDPANHAYFDEQYNVWIKPPEFENGIQYGWRYFDNKSQQWYGVPEPKKNVPNELLQIFPPYLIPVNYDGAAAYRVYGRYEPGSAATSSAAAPSSNSSGRGDLGNKKQKENSDEKTGKDSCCIIM